MSSRELRGLGTGGVGGRFSASVQEDQSQGNAWRIFQPMLGQPSPRRPVAARDVHEYSPPASAPSPTTVGAAQPAQQPVIVQPPQVTGFRLMSLPLLDGYIQQNTVCADCISSSVRSVIRQEVTRFASILDEKGVHRAPELAQNFLSNLHRRDHATAVAHGWLAGINHVID
jgi:hypothetical protein